MSKICSQLLLWLSCRFRGNLAKPLSNTVYDNGGVFGDVCASAEVRICETTRLWYEKSKQRNVLYMH